MKSKRGHYKAYFEDDPFRKITEGIWKVTAMYVNRNTGEIFKTGAIAANICLLQETQNLVKEIEKDGGVVIETKAVLINKVINK